MVPVPFVGVAIFSTSGYWAPTPWLSLQILSLSAMQKAADLEKVYPRRIWEVCVPILFGSENFRRGNVTENVKKAAELLNHVNRRPNSHPIDKVPIHLIMTFTAKESAGYHDIGINKTDHMFRSLNCSFVLFVGTKNRKSYERSLVKKSTMRYTVLCSSVLFLSWEKEYVHGKISRKKPAVRIFTRERADYIAHDLLTIPANDAKNTSGRFLEREIGWKKQNTQTGMRTYFSHRHCR